MDGNRRWARCRGLPVSAGHRAGAERAVQAVRFLQQSPIREITLYAFSSRNWQRPKHEVRALFQLASDVLSELGARCMGSDMRLRVIGRRERLPARLRRHIDRQEQATSHHARRLNIALDYSAQHALVLAARSSPPDVTRSDFAKQLVEISGTRPVDLLIRTGREHRLSDFLLWELANAELCFVDTLWPDFEPSELAEAIQQYHRRERRLGR